ncbi:MAG TPA: cytochrome C554, partial [Nitrosospira sp.]|nr:cytochrome C554 [Nitrosospira sp.]
RQVLADAGQDFAFEESCNACHMNYEGSPWKGAKKPYTPYHPGVDKKYTFNFDKYVKDVKAMHEHYKLDGVFEGEPKFKYHDDFQSKAKVGKKTEVED